MTLRKFDPTAVLLSLMMATVPAIGARGEELLQDTLKSMAVAAFVLAASFCFFWRQHKNNTPVSLHWVVALPVALMVYALGSMAWSHTYLAGVEAVRWFVFSAIVFLGMNVMTHARVSQLAWGIHLGAVLASLWTALQFWFDWPFFAQGPNPASTFVNRNFFAEYVVCTLPFSALLLTRVRDKASVFLLIFSLGFNMVALMMTGTRSALLGLLGLLILLPAVLFFYRQQWVSTGWKRGHGMALVALLVLTVVSLGSIQTGNAKLITETGQGTALDRALKRTLSITEATEYRTGSFSVRAQMWKATTRMIVANPVMGVGAGAWEVHIPKFQESGSQLEVDFYAHNEPLQLLAEYGVTGWVFLVVILAYLARSAYRTLATHTTNAKAETLLRACTLASLMVLFLVSNAGFPWRLASTDAIFALSLAVLAASDQRLVSSNIPMNQTSSWPARWSLMALGVTSICTGLAIYIAQQAVLCESMLVRATKIALTISASGISTDPRWENLKNEMLHLLQQGIAINPHYRKLTPISGDALANWGDWKNATWVWTSMLSSRPYIIGMLANVSRASLQAGEIENAQQYLDRALKVQPESKSLASLQAMIWSRSGREQLAMDKAQSLLASGYIDNELMQTAYFLGKQQHNPTLTVAALKLGIETWPNRAVDGWLKLGALYQSDEVAEMEKALQAYQAALNAAPSDYKRAVMDQIPLRWQHLMQTDAQKMPQGETVK